MTLAYKLFGRPKSIDDYFDYASKGKVVEVFVREYMSSILHRMTYDFGIKGLSNDVLIQRKQIKLPLNVGEEDSKTVELEMAVVRYELHQNAYDLAKRLTDASGKHVYVNDLPLDRAEHKLRFLESNVDRLKREMTADNLERKV